MTQLLPSRPPTLHCTTEATFSPVRLPDSYTCQYPSCSGRAGPRLLPLLLLLCPTSRHLLDKLRLQPRQLRADKAAHSKLAVLTTDRGQSDRRSGSSIETQHSFTIEGMDRSSHIGCARRERGSLTPSQADTADPESVPWTVGPVPRARAEHEPHHALLAQPSPLSNVRASASALYVHTRAKLRFLPHAYVRVYACSGGPRRPYVGVASSPPSVRLWRHRGSLAIHMLAFLFLSYSVSLSALLCLLPPYDDRRPIRVPVHSFDKLSFSLRSRCTSSHS